MRALADYAQDVNARLQELFCKDGLQRCEIGRIPELLVRSMGYSVMAGGKRLRPSMLLSAVDMLGGSTALALDFACAVEMIHSYSLIHDDLPGMDDDVLRRGQPTNHVVFGVGQAILAGDGLLNGAFELMLAASLRSGRDAQACLRAMREIATGAGCTGMIAGQVLDLDCERNANGDAQELSFIHYCKTACMFIYPLRAAARLCSADEAVVDALGRYGEAYGRMFQAVDDLLDVTGDDRDMGKTLGKDAEQGKLTAISELGIDGTRALISDLEAQAIEALSCFGEEADVFRKLVHESAVRTK